MQGIVDRFLVVGFNLNLLENGRCELCLLLFIHLIVLPFAYSVDSSPTSISFLSFNCVLLS